MFRGIFLFDISFRAEVVRRYTDMQTDIQDRGRKAGGGGVDRHANRHDSRQTERGCRREKEREGQRERERDTETEGTETRKLYFTRIVV